MTTFSSQSLLTCLPLLAGVLGQAHGLKVEVGGSTAATDGRLITLPDLPLDSPPEFIPLVRGYIDHEAAHIRYTDFTLLQQTKTTALEQRLTNIFEDWRVEDRQGHLFPGCRANLHALIRLQFQTPPAPETDPFLILNWILLTVRGWVVSELLPLVAERATVMDQTWPGLRPQLEAILDRVKTHCPDTRSCLASARRVARLLRRWSAQTQDPTLNRLLSGSDTDLPDDLGTHLRRQINAEADKGTGCAVAVARPKPALPLTPEQKHTLQRLTTGLKARLHGLLQSRRQERVIRSRRGRLDGKRLALAVTGEPRLHRRLGNKVAVNTAVHLLLDSSGSMRDCINRAVTCCTAMAQALSVRGVSVGVTTFPAEPDIDLRPTVTPLLRHGDPVREIPSVAAQGTTPLAEAILWCLHTLAPLSHPRKIILILTDGEPDSRRKAEQAVKAGRAMGVEFYGLGMDGVALQFLPSSQCRNITDPDELPAAVFALLQQAMIQSAGEVP